jgi:hypothetical protein
MKKTICLFAILVICFSSFAQAISNTSNTITFNISGTDCHTAPPAGTYELDLAYFDFDQADWVHINDITVTVTVSGSTFTIDASAVTPAVDLPEDELIYSVGNVSLTNTSTDFYLIFDSGYVNCEPLGIAGILSKVPITSVY